MADHTLHSLRDARFPIRFRTLPEALLAAPKEVVFATMWSGEDDVRTVTFGEFTTKATAYASYLQGEGVRRGDTVVLLMPQGIALMAAFMGALLLGAVPSIVSYPNFKVEPNKYRSGLAGVSANLKARLVILDRHFPDELLGHVSMQGTTRLVRCPEAPQMNSTLALALPEPDSLAFIQHSAGTTGLQKGVALSHGAVLRQLDHLSAALKIRAGDRIYSWLPLYHDMGLIACFMLPLVCHLPVVMQSPTTWVMQPRTMVELISQYRCTLAWVPNFTLLFLARRVPEEDRKSCDLSSLRALINCSEPVRAHSMDEFSAAYAGSGLQPHVPQSSYAMAETVFAVTQSGTAPSADPVRLWVDSAHFRSEHRAVPLAASSGENGKNAVCFVSSGKCLPGSDVRILLSSGEEAQEGGVGEIVIRSDSLFAGYYNRPDLTAKVLHDGWYRSGDLGFVWQQELFVVGRKKDLIIVAGENIYPQDVEDIAGAHPAIHDGRTVAFGLFNPELGTEDLIVVAEVDNADSLNDAGIIEKAIRNAIVAELGIVARAVYIKPPRWIIKSTAGKPARSSTREKLLQEHPELAAKDPLSDLNIS